MAISSIADRSNYLASIGLNTENREKTYAHAKEFFSGACRHSERFWQNRTISVINNELVVKNHQFAYPVDISLLVQQILNFEELSFEQKCALMAPVALLASKKNLSTPLPAISFTPILFSGQEQNAMNLSYEFSRKSPFLFSMLSSPLLEAKQYSLDQKFKLYLPKGISRNSFLNYIAFSCSQKEQKDNLRQTISFYNLFSYLQLAEYFLIQSDKEDLLETFKERIKEQIQHSDLLINILQKILESKNLFSEETENFLLFTVLERGFALTDVNDFCYKISTILGFEEYLKEKGIPLENIYQNLLIIFGFQQASEEEIIDALIGTRTFSKHLSSISLELESDDFIRIIERSASLETDAEASIFKEAIESYVEASFHENIDLDEIIDYLNVFSESIKKVIDRVFVSKMINTFIRKTSEKNGSIHELIQKLSSCAWLKLAHEYPLILMAFETEINDDDLENLSHLFPKIEYLDISNTEISKLPEKWHHSLQSLIISNTEIVKLSDPLPNLCYFVANGTDQLTDLSGVFASNHLLFCECSSSLEDNSERKTLEMITSLRKLHWDFSSKEKIFFELQRSFKEGLGKNNVGISLNYGVAEIVRLEEASPINLVLKLIEMALESDEISLFDKFDFIDLAEKFYKNLDRPIVEFSKTFSAEIEGQQVNIPWSLCLKHKFWQSFILQNSLYDIFEISANDINIFCSLYLNINSDQNWLSHLKNLSLEHLASVFKVANELCDQEYTNKIITHYVANFSSSKQIEKIVDRLDLPNDLILRMIRAYYSLSLQDGYPKDSIQKTIPEKVLEFLKIQRSQIVLPTGTNTLTCIIANLKACELLFNDEEIASTIYKTLPKTIHAKDFAILLQESASLKEATQNELLFAALNQISITEPTERFVIDELSSIPNIPSWVIIAAKLSVKHRISRWSLSYFSEKIKQIIQNKAEFPLAIFHSLLFSIIQDYVLVAKNGRKSSHEIEDYLRPIDQLRSIFKEQNITISKMIEYIVESKSSQQSELFDIEKLTHFLTTANLYWHPNKSTTLFLERYKLYPYTIEDLQLLIKKASMMPISSLSTLISSALSVYISEEISQGVDIETIKQSLSELESFTTVINALALKLEFTNISATDLLSLSTLFPRVVSLDISYSPINALPLVFPKTLQNLNISYTEITSIPSGFEELRSFKAIQTPNLTNISGLHHSKKLETLQIITDSFAAFPPPHMLTQRWRNLAETLSVDDLMLYLRLTPIGAPNIDLWIHFLASQDVSIATLLTILDQAPLLKMQVAKKVLQSAVEAFIGKYFSLGKSLQEIEQTLHKIPNFTKAAELYSL
ncbi:MAG: hypothetical protein FJZ56_00750 [Chlamydiae bacterium]|nr:hypothetical protein [Chlamydiota bacterium]